MEESSVEHGLKRSLEVGTEVEVSFDVLGLEGSWYEGTVVRCVPKKNRVTVEYRNLFRNLKGTRPVREILNYSMIRPRPPTVKEPVELELNQRVDAFDFDGWWVGYIVRKSDVETTFSSRRYGVYFPDSNLEFEFERSQLRLHQDWDGVKWVADAGFASQDLEGSNSVGDKVVQAGDVAGQENAAMEISTSPDSRDEAKGNSLELSKRVTRDEHKSLLPQKKSKNEATEGISSPTAFQEVTSGGETLREMLSQYQISDSPNIQVGLQGKMLAHRRNPSLIYLRTKQRRARTEGDLKVHKNRKVRKPHKVTKPEEQLGNVGDEQLNEKLLAPQTEPVTPVCLWDKDLQTQDRTSVIRLEEISNEASQNKGDEIIHEEQQKSPHQSSHDKVTKPEEQLGSVGDEQLNEKLHAPQTEPVTPIGLWDKDLQTQEKTSVIRLEEISNEATQDKGDEIIHEENQKSPHQSSRDHDEQRKVKANAVNPSCKELSPLPFVKRSPMWNMMESNVVFNTIPQSPHFQPLKQCSEVFREGMAIGHMLTFANVADAICKLHLGDHRSAFENMLKDLAELERHGFDGQLLQVRIERLLWLKDSILQSEDKLVEADVQIRGQRRQKDYLNTEIDTLDGDIAILREKRASVIETRKKTEENIERLQQDVQKVKEASHLAEEDFKKAAAIPWSAFHP